MAKLLALTKRAQFLAVYQAGRAFSDNVIVIKILNNGLALNRIGFSVNKTIGNAVERNRIRRLFRETTRVLNLNQGWDIVIIARRSANGADFHKISRSINRLLGRADLLKKE